MFSSQIKLKLAPPSISQYQTLWARLGLFNENSESSLYVLQGKSQRGHLNSLNKHFVDISSFSDSEIHQIAGLIIWNQPSANAENKIFKIAQDHPDINWLIVGHSLWNMSDFILKLQKYGPAPGQIIIMMADSSASPLWVRSPDNLMLSELNKYTLFQVSINPTKSSSMNLNDVGHHWPFVFISIAKFLLTPYAEIKKWIQWLKTTNFVWSKRMIELFEFLFFIITRIKYLYYFSHWLLGKSLKMTVPAFFLTRHAFLMSRFKTYGFLVDLFYFFERHINRLGVLIKVALIRLGYRLSHVFILTVSKTYGFAVDLFHLFERLVKIQGLRFLWYLRHIVLMIAFKSYGILIDFYHLTYFLVTRILPYPIFKIYWFCEFQYHKRVKKWLTQL